MSLLNQVRIERTREDVAAFSLRFDDWLARRRDADQRRQYASQLDAIERCVRRALEAFASRLRACDAGRPAAAVYDDCRASELRLLWLQRVWEFFRAKLDQRDDPVMGPVLRAADEVVWSAYRPAFDRCRAFKLRATRGPAPLPYIDFEHSPAAFPSSLVPPSLRSGVEGAVLAQFLDKLPVPVIRLPPSCIQAPWWLIHVGHEVGHHLQYDLEEDGALIGSFRELVRRAAEEAGASDEDQERWSDWSREIFADVAAVALMGPLALRATIEFELTAAPALLRRRDAYPSPLVRCHLLAAVAAQLGLPAPEHLALLDGVAADAATAGDLAVTGKVAEAAAGPLPGLGRTLAELVDCRPQDYQPGPAAAVAVWSARMRDTRSVHFAPQIRSACLATSGAFAAWCEVAAQSDEAQRAGARRALSDRARALIAACAPEGTREAQAQGIAPGFEDAFANALLGANIDELTPMEKDE
ncbi:hypothetical protein [Sorangium sp. So ce1000]|uniref:hypothetical protein n=1 Tax=Sorangium sp. So ce1000 TaxID=3133325 RepID=UPI003F5E14CF